MTPEELNKPSVPIGYPMLMLQITEEHGIDRNTLLSKASLPLTIFSQPDAKISILEYGRLCIKALELTDQAGLGYEFGLRNTMTTHGYYGFGIVSQPTIHDAILFAARYARLRMPGWKLSFYTENNLAIMEAVELVPFGILRQYALDMMLATLVTSVERVLPIREKGELWFDCPEPKYYPQYRDRLPPCRFQMGVNQLRFDIDLLSMPLTTANATTAKLAERECERELALQGDTEDFIDKILGIIRNVHGEYPDLESVARQLNVSSRTLKRHMSRHGTNYQSLLDKVRKRDAIYLLRETQLSLEEIAYRIGYTAPSNFIRAFQKWTRMSPNEFREIHR